jgi:hypothetical protein
MLLLVCGRRDVSCRLDESQAGEAPQARLHKELLSISPTCHSIMGEFVVGRMHGVEVLCVRRGILGDDPASAEMKVLCCDMLHNGAAGIVTLVSGNV